MKPFFRKIWEWIRTNKLTATLTGIVALLIAALTLVSGFWDFHDKRIHEKPRFTVVNPILQANDSILFIRADNDAANEEVALSISLGEIQLSKKGVLGKDTQGIFWRIPIRNLGLPIVAEIEHYKLRAWFLKNEADDLGAITIYNLLNPAMPSSTPGKLNSSDFLERTPKKLSTDTSVQNNVIQNNSGGINTINQNGNNNIEINQAKPQVHFFEPESLNVKETIIRYSIFSPKWLKLPNEKFTQDTLYHTKIPIQISAYYEAEKVTAYVRNQFICHAAVSLLNDKFPGSGAFADNFRAKEYDWVVPIPFRPRIKDYFIHIYTSEPLLTLENMLLIRFDQTGWLYPNTEKEIVIVD